VLAGHEGLEEEGVEHVGRLVEVVHVDDEREGASGFHRS
jgi:hypothetical protein